MHAHSGNQHHADQNRPRHGSPQPQRQQQTAGDFRDSRQSGLQARGSEPQLFHERCRSGYPVSAEPAEQLLGAMGSQRQAYDQPNDQESDVHFRPPGPEGLKLSP